MLPSLDRPLTGFTNEAVTAEELNVIVGSKPDSKLDKDKPNRIRNMVLREIENQFGLTEEDLAWAEIHAVPAMKAAEVGFDRGLIGAYGHDDRSCVYAAFSALSYATKASSSKAYERMQL